MTELYYLNYLYGFLVSALVYYVLHVAFPADRLDNFVQNAGSPVEVQRIYRETWEILAAQDTDSTNEEHQQVDVVDKC
jgi:NCS1 family nucleobase:cation symporter-1